MRLPFAGHARLREQLSAYVDGQLSSRELRRLDRHLARCADCRQELDSLRRTVDLLRELPPVELPQGLETRLMAHLDHRSAEQDRGRGPRWLRLGATATSLAGAALLALVFVDVDVRLGWPGDPALTEGDLESITLSQRPYERRDAPSLFLPSGAGTVGAGTVAGEAPPRFGFAAASAAPEEALALRPSLGACLSSGVAGGPLPAAGDACSRWQSWMLDLAAREPRAFVSEFETVPESQQPLILQDMRELAWGTGTASFVIDQLRSSGDPRASRLASQLAFASARAER
ncbi:MAG: zf-HC2 domain-containing protein [Myxococcota bacterium]|nr:zf-HC2 domain-containing protein [Myxococcota bacterium]